MKTYCLVALSLLAFNQAALSSDGAGSPTANSSPADRRSGISPGALNPTEHALAANYGKLPLSFEANRGQSDPRVKFLSRGNGYSLFLTDSAAVLALTKSDSPSGRHPVRTAKPAKTDVIRMELAGASPGLRVTGTDQLQGTANYFVGNDSKKWRSKVPTYAKVKYAGVYPGVDLVYYGNQRQLEYDFVVAPGADPQQVRLHFAAAKKLKLNADGDLEVIAQDGEIAFRKPVVYQMKDGQRQLVDGRFMLLRGKIVSFTLKGYDSSRELVIDPVLAYSTYLGGVGSFASIGGQSTAIAVDASGSAYVAGSTSVADFPTTEGAFQTVIDGSEFGSGATYAFVAKLDPTGSKLIYATYLAGDGSENNLPADSISSVFVDSAGDAYLAGTAYSAGFPVTSGAFQSTFYKSQGASDGFVVKLNSEGTELVYSTFLGGKGLTSDACTQVVVNSSGNAYVTGATSSSSFPVTTGAVAPYYKQGTHAFVTEFSPSGSSLVYSTYLGGTGSESGNAVAVDATGAAYIAGQTSSTDFPVTSQGYQTINYAQVARGESTGFVAKLDPTGSKVMYATYLGGSGGSGAGDEPTSIAVDSDGDAYVYGVTASQDFPIWPTETAFQKTNKTYSNKQGPAFHTTGFVTKLNPMGTSLLFSTYLGSSSGEVVSLEGSVIPADSLTGSGSLALDSSGNVYVTGTTYGIDFPVTANAFQGINNSTITLGGILYGGSSNAFLTELSSSGELVYSSYFGGSGPAGFRNPGDYGFSIALDPAGNSYLTGIAESPDFPSTPGAYQTNKFTKYTAFVSKFSFASASTGGTLTTLASSSNPQSVGGNVTVTASVRPTSGGGMPTGTVSFGIDAGSGIAVELDSTGHASYATSALPDGSHTITASYSGDANYSASSNDLTEVIAGAPTKIDVVSGSGQSAPEFARFPNSVVVIVTDANGTPVPNVAVTFGGQGLSYLNLGAELYVSYTGLDGKAPVGVIARSVGPLTGTASVYGVNTPAFFSLTGSTPVTQTPTFSVGTGVYSSAQLVTLTDQGATIYYTIDGTTPTASSKRYSGPITVFNTETIEAIAVASGYLDSGVGSATYTIAPGGPSAALQFVPATPCRVADTRLPNGLFGGPELGSGGIREFDIPQSACNIPSTAVAYSLNVTVVPDGALSYLTLWPSGQEQPFVSTLNSDGRVKANAAITPAGVNGGVNVFVSDASQVILDINGYFVLAGTTSELSFYPITPCRVADTRNAAGPLGGPFIAANSSRAFPVMSTKCGLPENGVAYSLNITAVPHTTLNYLTTWPTGQAKPYVSTLNSSTGTVTANAAIVPAGSNGDVSIFVSDTADVIIDVNGYFAGSFDAPGLSLYTVAPCRVIDTRPNPFNQSDPTVESVKESPCRPLTGAQAYVLNATVVPVGALNYLTLWPDGASQPNVSTLNADDGAVTSNMAIVPTTNGLVDAYASGATNLILDISGYFAP